MTIPYERPRNWLRYDLNAIMQDLANAKASMLALTKMPYQKQWADKLQEVQLKREIAGTSKIEGAEFSEKELESALGDSAGELLNRSQRQARSTQNAYRWLATIPNDRPIDSELIKEIHRKIIVGADDDHCAPGELRLADVNVTFGVPLHRGAEGGDECSSCFNGLLDAVDGEFKAHDMLVQALALHYHFAAIHPFTDGNGRTARALEALVMQRAGLKDLLFIAMSNYYYEEKNSYLETLSRSRSLGHNITPFLQFGLRGVMLQCDRLLMEIRLQVTKALFRDVMHQFFNRLQSTRKRVIYQRQIEILDVLLEADELDIDTFWEKAVKYYLKLGKKRHAFIRDVSALIELGAVSLDHKMQGEDKVLFLRANLNWPTTITQTDFFKAVKKLPQAKLHWLT